MRRLLRPHPGQPAEHQAGAYFLTSENEQKKKKMPSNKAIKTNAAILKAAREIVRTEGIDRLSMDRVAQKAGLSKGAVMYHFTTKRALQAALLEEYAEHMDSELHRHEAMFEGAPLEKLMAGYIEWFRSFARDNHGWSAVGVQLLGQQARDPELIKPVSDWYDRIYARLDKLPARQRTRFLTALMALEGLFFVHKFGVGHLGAERTQDILKFIAEATGTETTERRPEPQDDSGAADADLPAGARDSG